MKGRDNNRHKQTGAKVSCFVFFSGRTMTYLKAIEKGGIKITKDAFIDIPDDCAVLIVNRIALINLK